MKKQYQTPMMEVFTIKSQQLLAGSDITVGTDTGSGSFDGSGFGSRDLELDEDFMMKQLGL